jgi:hypothetical protein
LFRAGGDDPHACAIADVDADGLGDVFCARGARHGTIKKRNHLWMHVSARTFVDRAWRYGVTDPFGRGRHATFFNLNGDEYPDLFVGNESTRPNGLPTPNRTYLNAGGLRFQEVRIGATRELGAECAVAADTGGDARQDLLVCGNEGFHLFRNRSGPHGRRVLRDVAARYAMDLPDVTSAAVADLDLDGSNDVVLVQADRLTAFPGRQGGGFGPPRPLARLRAARWVTIGNFDGRRGVDLFVVQTCRAGRNVRDVALLDRGRGWSFDRSSWVPPADAGCGDLAASIDLDVDGADEVIVLNGMRGDPPNGGISGPVQVLTIGPYPG